MESNFLSPKPSSITNILTLRYDPSITPNLPRKTWNDFKPSIEKPSIEFIEKSIAKTLRKQLDLSSIKKISIALSGGVDSTLVLAAIRKIFPDITINAISIKFANSVDETIPAARIAEKFGAHQTVIEVENYLKEL